MPTKAGTRILKIEKTLETERSYISTQNQTNNNNISNKPHTSIGPIQQNYLQTPRDLCIETTRFSPRMTLQALKSHLTEAIQVPSTASARGRNLIPKPHSVADKRRSMMFPENVSPLEVARKNQFTIYNLVDPEYGIKYYGPIDTNMQEPCLYKSARIAMNKHDKQDHFTDLHAKQFKDIPAAKYNVLHDWSKPEMFASSVGKLRGFFRPAGKGLRQYRMSEQIMYDESKANKPAPNRYNFKDYFADTPKLAQKVDK
jgi:hypothetical protein